MKNTSRKEPGLVAELIDKQRLPVVMRRFRSSRPHNKERRRTGAGNAAGAQQLIPQLIHILGTGGYSSTSSTSPSLL